MDLRVDIEEEVKDRHFLRYSDYCEIKLLFKPEEYGKCYRCNKSLEPLTYLDPDFYYIPCWDCASKKKTENSCRKSNCPTPRRKSPTRGLKRFSGFTTKTALQKPTLSRSKKTKSTRINL